jgi:hypothetical protein
MAEDRTPIRIAEKSQSAWCELRPHLDGSLDELLANGVESVHLEQMDNGLWWLAIHKNGQLQVVWFESGSPINVWTERDQ